MGSLSIDFGFEQPGAGIPVRAEPTVPRFPAFGLITCGLPFAGAVGPVSRPAFVHQLRAVALALVASCSFRLARDLCRRTSPRR